MRRSGTCSQNEIDSTFTEGGKSAIYMRVDIKPRRQSVERTLAISKRESREFRLVDGGNQLGIRRRDDGLFRGEPAMELSGVH